MSVKRLNLALLAAVALAASGLSSTGMAQTPDETFFFDGRPYDPAEYYVYGPPDVAGCEPQCARDFSPCDSPMMKRTDGRCNHNF